MARWVGHDDMIHDFHSCFSSSLSYQAGNRAFQGVFVNLIEQRRMQDNIETPIIRLNCIP